MILYLAFLTTALTFSACSKCSSPSRPNIILISADTLRADHLSCYGYSKDTTPYLDRFAKDCVVFERAYSQIPGTLPSHMSIFTGLYPDDALAATAGLAKHNAIYPLPASR